MPSGNSGLDTDALVIGGGPAGLMAAEVISAAGHHVILADAKRSFGRKLLMAGKSGLNLTFDQDSAAFLTSFWHGGDLLAPHLADFGPDSVRAWASDLGQETFRGSSGRIFPSAMKASPLLRTWLRRLEGQGVALRTRWRWTGPEQDGQRFDRPDGPVEVKARAVVLAMGGGSWARLGSDGAWRGILEQAGIVTAPFRPSNVGFGVGWSGHMARHFGSAVKPVRLRVEQTQVQAEFVVTARGVEGGGVYALSHLLRDGARLSLDLLPDRSEADVLSRLERPRGRLTLANHLRRSLGLSPVKVALLRECAGHRLDDLERTARSLKSLSLPVTGPFDIDEAISTGGGVTAEALTNRLMLRAWPGVFCAGEMLDWDAPTGGYLLTACLATGRAAGRSASAWINHGHSEG